MTDRSYGLRKCRGCGLVFTAPRPTPEELQRFYDSSYFSKTATPRVGGYSDYAGLPEANARFMWSEFSRLAPDVAGRHGRILDYGCATGGFLDEARKAGWAVQGVELSPEAAERARDVLGLPVLVGDLFDARLDGERYDLLTMWHVLEHVVSPAAVLRRARELAADGGCLFIELPSWNSAARFIKGVRWRQLRPPEHINFFTPASLATAVRQAGFRVAWAASAYPSLTNRVRLKAQRSPADFIAAAAGGLAGAMGFGGYARVLAVAN